MTGTNSKLMVESEHFGGALKILAPKVFEDERGFFLEAYREDEFSALGIKGPFLQDNHSRSMRGVVRGLHFQYDAPMAKLMRVTVGRAFVVAVDLRLGSPTAGEWFGTEISADDRRMVWAPASFARGFCALSDVTEVQYKCTAIYNPKTESGILWNDPAIGIRWPITDCNLSEKDRNAQSLAAWFANPAASHFTWEG